MKLFNFLQIKNINTISKKLKKQNLEEVKKIKNELKKIKKEEKINKKTKSLNKSKTKSLNKTKTKSLNKSKTKSLNKSKTKSLNKTKKYSIKNIINNSSGQRFLYTLGESNTDNFIFMFTSKTLYVYELLYELSNNNNDNNNNNNNDNLEKKLLLNFDKYKQIQKFNYKSAFFSINGFNKENIYPKFPPSNNNIFYMLLNIDNNSYLSLGNYSFIFNTPNNDKIISVEDFSSKSGMQNIYLIGIKYVYIIDCNGDLPFTFDKNETELLTYYFEKKYIIDNKITIDSSFGQDSNYDKNPTQIEIVAYTKEIIEVKNIFGIKKKKIKRIPHNIPVYELKIKIVKI